MAKVERAIRVEALDINTCGFCDDAEGIVVALDSPEYDEYKPPNGCEGADLCRGIYAYIIIDEPVKPLLTPKGKLPKIVKPFVPTAITQEAIKIEDQLDVRMGLTDRERKAVIKIEKSNLAIGNKRPKLGVVIKMRNGKRIYLYDKVPVRNMIPAEQEFIREVIGHYDKGLGNLDKIDSIVLDFKKARKGAKYIEMGGFNNTNSKIMYLRIRNIIARPHLGSVHNTIYHEGTHAFFYDRYINITELRETRAGGILKQIGELGDQYKEQISKGLQNVLEIESYAYYPGEELICRYIGMIKQKDISGKYLATEIKSWGKMTPEIRKILMKEGLL